jgi:hypothetical protein
VVRICQNKRYTLSSFFFSVVRATAMFGLRWYFRAFISSLLYNLNHNNFTHSSSFTYFTSILNPFIKTRTQEKKTHSNDNDHRRSRRRSSVKPSNPQLARFKQHRRGLSRNPGITSAAAEFYVSSRDAATASRSEVGPTVSSPRSHLFQSKSS